MAPTPGTNAILSAVNPVSRGWGDLAGDSRALASQAGLRLTTPFGPGFGPVKRNGIEQIGRRMGVGR